MAKESSRTLDGFLEALEKRTRAARTISIAITAGLIVLAAITLYFAIHTIRRQVSLEQDKLKDVQQQVAAAKDELQKIQESLKATSQSRDDLRTALAQAVPEKGRREALLENAAKINQTSSNSPKVYLQILDNDQRPQAKVVSDVLTRKGFKVQGIQWIRLPVTGINKTQVRYFRPDFADEAKQIAALLQQAGVSEATAVPLNLSADTGQIEVWFPRDAFPQKPDQKTPSKGLESIELSRAAASTLFEFLEALKRPADYDEAIRKLQAIVAELGKDRDAVPYLATAKLSSKDNDGFSLRNGLIKVRKAIREQASPNFDLMTRVDRTIVEMGR